MLYPLFVHNIGALLYHPTNQTRTSQVMAAAERRRQEQQGQVRSNPPTGLPSIQQHHHHSMALPGPQSSLPSQNNMPRPPLDRNHAFPTPPTSASGVIGIGPSDNFNWQGPGINGASGTNNPIAIDAGLGIPRPVLTTPATTPPGTSSMPAMPTYSSASQPYDGPRNLYSAPTSQQSPYQTSNNGTQDRMYAQPSSYVKSEMGPPSSRPPVSAPQAEQHDGGKAPNGIMTSDQGPQHQPGEDEADHEHDAEYTHDSGAYDASRTPYNYTAPGVGALVNDANMPSEMAGSPGHPPVSGRATPRTAAPHQPYYPQHPGYSTPPRVQQTTGSSLFNVMSNDRTSTNGAPTGEVYAPSADMTNTMTNGYVPQPPVMNGSAGSLKRGRDDDDDISRPSSEGPGAMGGLDLKRRKTLMDPSVSGSSYDGLTRSTSTIAAPPRR